MFKSLIFTLTCASSVLALSLERENKEPLILPQPEIMLLAPEEGSIVLPPNLTICPALGERAPLLNIEMALQALREMKFSPDIQLCTSTESSNIAVNATDSPTENYELIIRKERPQIKIRTGSYAGLFYALQTLTAILKQGENPMGYTIPHVYIIDKPLFAYRGLHLDVSRHFFPPQDIHRLLDTMALMKLNKLHLHLSDGPGWRLQINSFPNLTSCGAWRIDQRSKAWDWARTEIPQQEDSRPKYGGFYTQEEMKALIRYAGSLSITIIPEIDIPGHSYAAMVSYPSLACDNNPPSAWLRGHDVLCVGKKSTTEAIKKILEEVDHIFPKSTPIHIGGDEVLKEAWLQCKDCRQYMQDNGLKTGNELQSSFINEIIHFLKTKNREVIVWDEAFAEGMKEDATIMVWREDSIGKQAAEAGHKTILTPSSHFYLDYYQGPKDKEPLAIGGDINLEKIYNYPLISQQIKPEFRDNIQGLQANIWTEYMQTMDQVEYMAWPRGCALAERAWSAAPPNMEDFNKRLTPYLQMMKNKGIKFHPMLQIAPSEPR